MNRKHFTTDAGGIEKTAAGSDITPEQLEQINALTRRKLAAEEVFIFSVILCDNEIDRDGERFPRKSLEALAPLFVGKTGIFDHSAQAKHQSARIFDTAIVVDEHRQAPGGELYAALKAWAYMVRCDKNEDLILEIDAGIKKEVSVGCAVAEILCSVCGADQKKSPCAHRKGEVYSGVECHHLLCEPTDAYEWSFVAVPAQKSAGVTKGRGTASDGDPLEKLEKAYGPVELSAGEVQKLREHLRELDTLAVSGKAYLDELRRDAVRMAALAHPRLQANTLEQIAAGMDAAQLKAFSAGLRESAAKTIPLPQLAPKTEQAAEADRAFRI